MIENFKNEVSIRLCDVHTLHLVGAGRKKPMARHTPWYWHTRGIGGVFLDALRIGKVLVTTLEELIRFFEATNGLENGSFVNTAKDMREELALWKLPAAKARKARSTRPNHTK